MKEFMLDEPLANEFLNFLKQFGTVRILNETELPFFSFEKENFISIKGFIGERSVEVRYKKEFSDLVADYFHLLLFYYREGDKGAAKLKRVENSIWKMMRVRMGLSE